MNKVVLVGRLTKDIELKVTPIAEDNNASYVDIKYDDLQFY